MVIFRVDGNVEIGVGHFSRCISIAKKMIELNQELIFVLAPDSDFSMLKTNNLSYYRMEKADKNGWSVDEFVNWLNNNSSYEDVVFLDSYRITKNSMKKIQQVRKTIYLDDLSMFDYPVDVVINYNIESSLEQYLPTQYHERKLFLGTKFFPVRDEFGDLKKDAVSKTVKRVLLTSSSTDPSGALLKILKFIDLKDNYDIQFVVLEGLFFDSEYKDRLHRYAELHHNLSFLEWGQEMAEVLSDVDLVICPGSTVMLESFVIGVPCISFSFVDNHLPLCKYCNDNNIAPYIGDFSTYVSASYVKDVFRDAISYQDRTQKFKLFREIIDDLGCSRIAEVVLGEIKCIK